MDETPVSRLPKNVKDISGKQFDRLTIMEFSHIGGNSAYWRATCVCGTEKVVRNSGLGKLVRSCGCLHREAAAEQGRRSRKHGQSRSRLENIYHAMMARCYKPKAVNYQRYGGKGIAVCEEWRNSCAAFYQWALANGYDDHLELDRKETGSSYSPGNCRWVTSIQNQNNRGNNKRYEFNGESLTASEWSRRVGIHRSAIKARLNRGWPMHEVLVPLTDTGALVYLT